MIVFASVSIIGCGWLGTPLALALLSQGYQVKGSTTSKEKIPVLQKAGISSFYLQVNDAVQGQGIADFFASDIVVITLPFRRDFLDPHEYHKQISSIVNEVVKSPKAKFIIFTSSTSVYPDHILRATEDLVFIADNPRAHVLQNIENELLANKNFKATIVRFAGLYGPDRKIGGFLAGQRELAGAQNAVNLIHQDDAVGILRQIIVQNVHGEIFNACADAHPTRKELYSLAAQQMGLKIPQFTDEPQRISKIVINDKVKKVLDYQFIHPDPLADIVSTKIN